VSQRPSRLRARVIKFVASVPTRSLRLPGGGRMPACTAKVMPSYAMKPSATFPSRMAKQSLPRTSIERPVASSHWNEAPPNVPVMCQCTNTVAQLACRSVPGLRFRPVAPPA
jgi:hypothetical protein